MSEKQTTAKKKPGRRPKADKTAAPVERDKVEERQAAATPAAGAETGNAPAPETGNASEPSPSAGGSNETAEADNRNGGAVGESGAPDNGSGRSGENPEQAAHAPDQNGDIPEQSEEGAAQAAPEAGGGGAAEEERPPAAQEGEEAQGGDPKQAAPAAEGWTVARVLKITKPLMKGEDVKALQAALIARGYHCGASGASGVYERNTAYAVRCFQAASRLIVDGRAGRFTVAALGGTWNG